MTTVVPLLEAIGIEKSFGATRALTGANLSIGQGEVVALVGENGAGKSTLGKILAGATRIDEGRLLVNGVEVDFRSTRDALAGGIAIVLQEFNLIPEMSVAENIFLTRPEGHKLGWWRNPRHQIRLARDLISRARLGITIQPETLVSDLSVAEQQLVEIVRSLAVDAKLFILDEPTASLGKRETDALLELIRRLRSDGRSVVLVTHRLDEVFAVADRIVVLRDGIIRAELSPSSTTTDELVEAMVGRELDAELHQTRTTREPGEVVLEVAGVAALTGGESTFAVRRGEIVGIAGLVGSGRSELVRAIFGADKVKVGTVRINGSSAKSGSPLGAIRAGAAMVSEDRKSLGLHIKLPISDNIALAHLAKSHGFWVSPRRVARDVGRKVSELGIKVDGTWLEAGVLSGGNQQKVVLAKWLLTGPDLLILDEPTRGIDVGARAEFYRMVNGFVSGGMAVLLVSSELSEILALSDRILVMNDGAVAGEISRADATEVAILSITEVGSGKGKP